jgi:hypothetical protein
MKRQSEKLSMRISEATKSFKTFIELVKRVEALEKKLTKFNKEKNDATKP